MKKIISSILITTIFFSGCTMQLAIKEKEDFSDYCKRVNEKCSNEVVEISYSDSIKVSGINLEITPQITKWEAIESGETFSIETKELNFVSYQDNTNGVSQGALLGAGFGILIGLITFGIIGLTGGAGGAESGGWYLLGSAVSSLPGILLGAIGGGIYGSKTIFEIPPKQYSLQENGANIE